MIAEIWENIEIIIIAMYEWIMVDFIGLSHQDIYPHLAAKICEYCCQEICQCGATPHLEKAGNKWKTN